MKPVQWLVLLALSVPLVASAGTSPLQLRGYSLTDWYTFESGDSTRHHLLYQTLSLRLERPGVNSFGLVTHMRWQGDSEDDFGSSSVMRAHNLYLRFNHANLLDLRIGRQFLAEGVGFGTFDALRLSHTLGSGASIALWGGLAAPASREFEVQKADDALAYGGAVRARVTEKVSLLGSYLYEESNALKFRHRAGVSGTVALPHDWTGTALAHFNLSGPTPLHRLRALMRYNGQTDYRLSLEWTMGTPQLFPDSPFKDLEIATYQLVRLTGGYQVAADYWVGLRVQSILTTDEPNTTLGFTLEGPWGMFGYRQRFGDFGDESGLFGSAQYRLCSFAQIYGSADFSHYQFQEWTDREDQVSGQAGLRLSPVKRLMVDASLQALKNMQFYHDVRGLVRVKWSFSN